MDELPLQSIVKHCLHNLTDFILYFNLSIYIFFFFCFFSKIHSFLTYFNYFIKSLKFYILSTFPSGWCSFSECFNAEGNLILIEMTKAFTAGVTIFIEQFWARWPWSIGTYIGVLTVGVLFIQSPGIFHSQDSFPSTFHPRLWETSAGVVVIGVFTAEAHRELWACPSRLCLMYLVHAYRCSVIDKLSGNRNLIRWFLYIAAKWNL